MSTAAAESKPERLNETITPVAPFLVSNDLLNDPVALRARLAERGYLFMKGILDRDALLNLRRDVLSLCRAHGWLKEGAPLMDGIFRGEPFPNEREEYIPLYRKLIHMASFNAFSVRPEIIALFETLLEGPVLAHKRNIARISFPRHFTHTTQAHQDFFYIRGSAQTYTAWMPLGDCPRELGGVAVCEGSHRNGFLEHQPAVGAGNNGIPQQRLDGNWVCSDYEAGDLVLFHSHTVHGALPNASPDRLRLSLDFRYQLDGDAIDPKSMEYHLGLNNPADE